MKSCYCGTFCLHNSVTVSIVVRALIINTSIENPKMRHILCFYLPTDTGNVPIFISEHRTKVENVPPKPIYNLF